MRQLVARQIRSLVLRIVAILLTLFVPQHASAVVIPTPLFDPGNHVVEVAQPWRSGGGGFRRNGTPSPQRQVAPPQQRQNIRQQTRQRFDQMRVIARQKMEVMRQTRDRMVERLRQFRVQARQALDRSRKFLSDQRQRAQAFWQQHRQTREEARRSGSSKSLQEAGAVVRKGSAVAAVLLGVGNVFTPNMQERLAALSDPASPKQSAGSTSRLGGRSEGGVGDKDGGSGTGSREPPKKSIRENFNLHSSQVGGDAALPTIRMPAALHARILAAFPKKSLELVHFTGIPLPKSQRSMIELFRSKGFPSQDVISPTSNKVVGTLFIFPDGSRVRVMEPDGRNSRRASFENSNEHAIDPVTGKQPQPDPNNPLTAREWKKHFREQTHMLQDD